MKHLPPLNALVAFDAVVRHKSIKMAANELCVTPGAISKQITQLEQYFGLSLFTRKNREISINETGEQLHDVIAQALFDIAGISKKIKFSNKKSTLKIRSYTTFSIRWLIPHLPRFLGSNLDISVELTTSQDPVDFDRDEIDCAIRLGDGKWPNSTSTKLIDNVIVPVCSPKYLERKKIKAPKDLLSCNLLHIKRRLKDWNYWFSECGLSGESVPEGMMCENSEIAYTAAKEGLGIAIAQYFLVREDIESGKLVQPLKQLHDCGSNTYYLVMPLSSHENIDSLKFKEWILEEIQGCKDRP